MDYTSESLATLDRAGDELADATVATLFERGEMAKFNNLMRWFHTSGQELPPGLPAIIITGTDIPVPPRAVTLLRKDQLTRERLAFAIRRAVGPSGRADE